MFVSTLKVNTVRAFECLYLYKADKSVNLKFFLSWDYFEIDLFSFAEF